MFLVMAYIGFLGQLFFGINFKNNISDGLHG